MKVKGLVLEIKKNKVIVLTPDGQFRSLPKKGEVKVGDEYTYTTSFRPYLAVAASLALLLVSSVLLPSVFEWPLFAGEGNNSDPLVVAQNDPAPDSDLPPVKTERPDPAPQEEKITPAPDPAEEDAETPVEPDAKADPVETTEDTPPKPPQQPPSKPPAPKQETNNVKQEPQTNQEPAKDPAAEKPETPETEKENEQKETPPEPDPEVVVAEEEPLFEEANRGGFLAKWLTDLSGFFTGGKAKE